MSSHYLNQRSASSRTIFGITRPNGLHTLWPTHSIWSHRFGPWQHQAITWTNGNLSSRVCCGIHMGAFSEEMLLNLIWIIFTSESWLHFDGCHAQYIFKYNYFHLPPSSFSSKKCIESHFYSWFFLSVQEFLTSCEMFSMPFFNSHHFQMNSSYISFVRNSYI